MIISSVLYGMPAFSPKLQKDIDEGKIVLGGCCISLDNPSWECADCHEKFREILIGINY